MQKNFLRPSEVEECETDLRELNAVIENSRYVSTPVNLRQVNEAKRAIEKRLEQAPPEITAKQRDKVSKRIAALEEEIKVGILSHEEIRRNPPGAVEQNLRWQKANQQRIFEWKNFQLALHKGAPQEYLSDRLNVARLRPSTSHLDMNGAQIPVTTTYSFPTQKYQEGYDLIDWNRDERKPEFEPDVIEELDLED
jgi:hypothetical protein